MNKEVSYQEFTLNWSKAISAKNPLELFTMDLSVSVRCLFCKQLVNGEDSIRGAELYCPKCGAAWVLMRSKK